VTRNAVQPDKVAAGAREMMGTGAAKGTPRSSNGPSDENRCAHPPAGTDEGSNWLI